MWKKKRSEINIFIEKLQIKFGFLVALAAKVFGNEVADDVDDIDDGDYQDGRT